MKKSEKALELFGGGFNCAQAVAAAFAMAVAADATEDEKTILRAMSGFGAGIGRTDQVCGAVSGAVLIIGLKHAKGKESKELIYSKVKEFTERFKTKNGSLSCTALIGCNMSTPEGLAEAKQKDAHNKTCPKFVRDAVEILEEIL
jgi:C_GCAxxG_C_C family probable redox protein